LCGATFASSAWSADLLQTYSLALANDAVYASARSAQTAGQEKLVQGRARLLPAIGLSGSYNRVNSDSSPDYSNHGYTLSLRQPLFNVGNWEAYEQGKLLTTLADTQFAQAQQDLIVRTAQAYFDILAAQDTLSFIAQNQAFISQQLEAAKRSFEVGTTTITDTNEAQAAFDLAQAQQIAAESDLEFKRAALQQIIGDAPATLAKLRPGVKLAPPQPSQINLWVTSAEQQNYEVLRQQIALEIAKRQIKLNRSGHYPTLDLVASRNHNNSNQSGPFGSGGSANSNSIGVQWTIPLFSGFAIDSSVREAIALEDKARNDLLFTQRTSAQAARQSFVGVTNGLAQVRALEAAEKSSQSSLDSNKLGYEVGVRINIDVLNAQQQLFLTRRDLAKARYDTLMNSLKLKAASGSLREQDLAQLNQLLIETSQ
ncbi:MAG: TolC family outer membrane protein, partial [Herbaspirillum sp.]